MTETSEVNSVVIKDTVAGTEPSARVQWVETPIASPGCCVICGKSQCVNGFLWPQLDFEFYGTLYICGDCVGDFVRPVGWLDPDSARIIKSENDALTQEIMHLTAELEQLEAIRDGSINYARSIGFNSDGTSGLIPEFKSANDQRNDTSSIEDFGIGSGDIKPKSETVSESESKPNEPVSVKRSDDLSDARSDAEQLLGELGI